MAEKHKLQGDGLLGDGVTFFPADQARLAIYEHAHEQLAKFEAPVLIHARDPHEYLFVAALDGTGNDVDHDPEHATNVAHIRNQIMAHVGNHPHIRVDYVAGAGTEANPIKRAIDGASGYTCEERAELMYKKFIEQAKEWHDADRSAHISLADIGFSRGADEVAIFARLVHERGIQNSAGAEYTYTAEHLVKHVEYTRPPLVPPGQVAQVVALMDPVGTGNEVRNDDRRLPPSVISGLQLSSTDEHRSLFKADHIIDPGTSPDGRFIGIYVPGAHSDVGGGYHRDGLSNRAGNLVIDYLNSLSDEPYLAKLPEPGDPQLNVVHRSDRGMFIYRVTPKVDRLKPEGYRELLVPEREVGKVPDPFNNEPRDEAISRRYAWQRVQDGPLPTALSASTDPQTHALSQQVDRMLAAARAGDWSGFMQGNERFAAMSEGQGLRTDARAAADAQLQAPPPPTQETAMAASQGRYR